MFRYDLELGGISLPVSFYFPNTAHFFGEYCVPASEGPGIYIPEWYWAQWTRELREADAHGEYSAMAAVCSSALLSHGRCVFHAAAVDFSGAAWLIAAPSGVGKTTHAEALCALRPGAVGVISGDRPVLERCADGSVIVWPSPWNGKEDHRGAPAAPLAGTVLLSRGEADSLVTLTAKEAAMRVYAAVFQTAADADTVHGAAALAEAVLNAAPAWELTSRDPDCSAALLLELMEKGGGEDGI